MDTKQILKHEEKTGIKKGGPYTGKQRHQRQNKVYHMHFEKGYSAVRIANELGVSRNTINSDIQNCYSEIVEEFPKRELSYLLLGQIQALRFQKERLVEYTKDKTMEKKKLDCEKLINGIDCKIADIVLKLNNCRGHGTNIFKKQEDYF